jgi:photosystem II stability/assembly factor-like uncharacterized protein
MKRHLVVLFAATICILTFGKSFAQHIESERKGDAVKLLRPYKWEFQSTSQIPAGKLFKTESQTWSFMGPAPLNSDFYGEVSGRISSLAVDPTNSNVAFAAAAGGGLWKTTDGGTTWSPMTDDLPRLSSGSVAIDPNDPSTIYYGTGELNFSIDSYPGEGIFKSTDGGATWSQVMPFTSNGALYYTGKIVVASNSTVYAAGYYDAYKSTDGGQTWKELDLTFNPVSGRSPSAVDDIAVDPTNPNVIYASYGSFWSGDSSSYGVHKSTDGGTSWTWLTNGLPPATQIKRASLAIAASNNQALYAAINGNKPGSSTEDTNRVYKSTNGGASWTLLPSVSSTADFGGNQGWYNNVIAVDPAHPDTVYLGGIDFWRSSNGGQTWTNLTNGYGSYNGKNIHPDQHAIGFANGNGAIIYIGNDGGVWKSTNGASTFTNCNATLQTIQFYDIDVDQNNSSITVGGTQDNGTVSNKNEALSNWNEIYSGDGGYVLIDPQNSNNVYTEYVNGTILKSTDGGRTFQQIASSSNIGDGYWLTPYVMDPVNDNLLYVATSKIYESTNGGTNWTALTGNLKSTSDLFTTMSISPVEGSVIYAGISGYRGAADSSFLYVTTNGGTIWTNITANLPGGTNFARVTADPKTKGTAYLAVLSGITSHVLRTTDYGKTWNGLDSPSNGFASVPTKVIAIDSTDGHIYAGTYWGVYLSTDNGSTWTKFGAGLPIAVVDDIAIQYSTHTIRVGTHGRGVWQIGVTTGIASSSSVQYTFAVNQNYPNPFNPTTDISYQLQTKAHVTLTVYDLIGNLVTTLVNEDEEPGVHHVIFDGSHLATGVYFYKLVAGNAVTTKKMVLLK